MFGSPEEESAGLKWMPVVHQDLSAAWKKDSMVARATIDEMEVEVED